jgi:ubiquinone/menaquinone biosynthesis C-methylase UbiE
VSGLAEALEDQVERRVMADIRRRMVRGLDGRVLEIGCGAGATFSHVGPDVCEIVGLEPDRRACAQARTRGAALNGRVAVLRGSAEALPFAAASFDHLLSICVLCSVPDLAAALAEVRRVLRPGGRLHFYEHGRSPSRPVAALQDALTPLWRAAMGGCQPNRDVEAAIAAAGFRVTDLAWETPVPPLPPFILVRHHLRGRALRP